MTAPRRGLETLGLYRDCPETRSRLGVPFCGLDKRRKGGGGKGGDRLQCTPKLRQTGRRLIGDTSAGFVSFY